MASEYGSDKTYVSFTHLTERRRNRYCDGCRAPLKYLSTEIYFEKETGMDLRHFWSCAKCRSTGQWAEWWQVKPPITWGKPIVFPLNIP